MANTATTLYDAFLNVHNQLSVPLTDGTIELDSGTLERPIPSTIDPDGRIPTIVVSANNSRSEGVITYSANIDGEVQTFKLFFLKSKTEIVASATPKSAGVDIDNNTSQPLQVRYTLKLD